MKKLTRSILLLLALTLIFPVTSMAAEIDTDTDIVNGIIVEVPEEVRAKDLEKQKLEIDKLINQKILEDESLNAPNSQYNYEYMTMESPTKRTFVSGPLSGQPNGGSRIDGGFVILTDVGTAVPVTVTVGLPDVPYLNVSFNLGQVIGQSETGSGVSGYFLRTPDGNKYYKAHVDKEYDVVGYATYRRLKNSNDPWQLYTSYPLSTLFRQHYYCQEVK